MAKRADRQGGRGNMSGRKVIVCFQCNYEWTVPWDEIEPLACPSCGTDNTGRAEEGVTGDVESGISELEKPKQPTAAETRDDINRGEG